MLSLCEGERSGADGETGPRALERLKSGDRSVAAPYAGMADRLEIAVMISE